MNKQEISTPGKHNPESGQAIVLMAFLMIVLLAFLGLAVDGGGLYFLWRSEQNAVDAAVLAASYARCTGNYDLLTASELHDKVVAAGLASAEENGFTHNGTNTLVTINHPPTDGIGAGDTDFTEVIIQSDKPSYFIHLVYPQPLVVTNSAVGMCEPPFDGSSVPGLWAGSLVCQNTVNWTGSKGYIEGGLFSNFEIKITGSNGEVVGPAEAVSAIEESNAGNVNWDDAFPPATGVDPKPDPLNLDIGLYAPGGDVWNVAPLHTEISQYAPVADPDYKKQGGDWTWNPSNGRPLEGLYYVEGNVSIGNGVNFGSRGITIVATGEIQFSGGADVKYYDGVMNEVRPGVRYPGLLLFSAIDEADSCGNNGVKFSGSSIEAIGVMYAPKSGVDISGSNVTIIGNVVANVIDYSGSDGKLYYDPSLLPPRPPSIQIAE